VRVSSRVPVGEGAAPTVRVIEGGSTAGNSIAEKGTNLLNQNAPKTHQSLYRICPYGVDPGLKPCLDRDAHGISSVGCFQLFEQKHAVHLHRLLA
jgi:hypothetical protein